MSSQRIFSLSSLFSFAAVAATLATGCSSAEVDSLRPSVEVINRAASALSSGSITAINGTYGAECDGRNGAGTESWTYVIENANASNLSVHKNDANCTLTVTSLVAGDTFIAAPAITLATAWQLTASEFAVEDGPLAFYGNAKISDSSWAEAPVISILVSDSPNASDAGSKGDATFATESADVSAATVPASSYTISFAGFHVVKDAENVVQSVSGFAQLTEDGRSGQDFAIFEGELTGASALSDIAQAFAGAQAKGLLSSLDSLQLQAADFGLVGLDLDTSPKRTVILRNTENGVSSYQLLLVTFIP